MTQAHLYGYVMAFYDDVFAVVYFDYNDHNDILLAANVWSIESRTPPPRLPTVIRSGTTALFGKFWEALALSFEIIETHEPWSNVLFFFN